jgi:hypothetical protein
MHCAPFSRSLLLSFFITIRCPGWKMLTLSNDHILGLGVNMLRMRKALI